jgi:hypothetical protein
MLLDAVRTPRSLRVLIDIPLRVDVNRAQGTAIEELTKTVLVNARGALITLAASVGMGQRLSITNVKTNRKIECTVVHRRSNPRNKEIVEVGIAFDEPAPRFWGLSFPPEDWRPEDRKRSEASPMPA